MTPESADTFASKFPSGFDSQQTDVFIAATGAYLPDYRLTNNELANRFNVTPEWIERTTGICERRIASPDEAASDLAIHAARNAIEDSGLSLDDIDLLIVATTSPDTLMPSTACRVQEALKLKQIPSLDLSASCSGFPYALQMARGQLLAGLSRCALVIATEIRSRFVNPNDLDTSLLYGDGAGAAILTLTPLSQFRIRDIAIGADGSGANVVKIPAGGSREPATLESVRGLRHSVTFKKIPLVRNALRTMVRETRECLRRNGIEPGEITSIIPHQMNGRLICRLADRLGYSPEMMVNLSPSYGNVAGASSAIALDHWVKKRKTNGIPALSVLVTFGGGYTWGTVLIEQGNYGSE